MAYVVASPGSCGELVQGYGDGTSFMITCPIDRYSRAESHVSDRLSSLPEKSEMARRLTLQYLGQEHCRVYVRLTSEIPVGKGMASSTADISAVCQATALACGTMLTAEEIAAIAIAIEPSDGIFYPGIVQFDYRSGVMLRALGPAPAGQILIYDCGGEVDTLAFNRRKDLVSTQKANEGQIQKAMAICVAGMRDDSIDRIGEAATISAFANQRLLYKDVLNAFYEAGKKAGGRGVITAHSGTVLGLLLAADDDADRARHTMDRLLGGAVDFLDHVCMTNSGMIIEEV